MLQNLEEIKGGFYFKSEMYKKNNRKKAGVISFFFKRGSTTFFINREKVLKGSYGKQENYSFSFWILYDGNKSTISWS